MHFDQVTVNEVNGNPLPFIFLNYLYFYCEKCKNMLLWNYRNCEGTEQLQIIISNTKLDNW